MTGYAVRETFSTPHSNPVHYWIRPDTSDWNTCNAINGQNDEYHLPEGLTGWAVDVGAHIGACAVALAIDNPGLHVIAIEALPENVDLIRQNVELNGLTDRITVIHGGATDVATRTVRVGYGDVADPTGIHEFIGNGWAPEDSRFAEVPGISLLHVLEMTGNQPIRWMKIDCEGCERPFLDPMLLKRVQHIEGEVHPQAGGAYMDAVLSDTHDVRFPGWDANPDFGPFTAHLRDCECDE